MSAFGRAAGAVAPEVIQVIREVMRELDGLGQAARGGAREVDELGKKGKTSAGILGGFAEKAGNRFVKDFGFSMAGNIVANGTSVTNAATEALMRAGSNIPIFGEVFGQVQNPLDQAGNRVLGVTSMIARAGGTVTDEMRQSLFNQILPQEVRAQRESEAVARLQGNTQNYGMAMEGSRFGAALDGFASALDTVTGYINSFFGGGAGGQR